MLKKSFERATILLLDLSGVVQGITVSILGLTNWTGRKCSCMESDTALQVSRGRVVEQLKSMYTES